MRKPVRKINTGTLIQTLIEEGYKTTKSRGEDRDFDALEHNFHIALQLAKKLQAHRNTVDFVLRDYVARSKRTSWIMHTIDLPSPNTMLEFARLGASRSAVELLAKEFARCGITGAFLAATKLLGRNPEEAEVAMLVKDYINGATGSSEMSETQEKLIELAKGVSREFGERISGQLASRRRRLALCCD